MDEKKTLIVLPAVWSDAADYWLAAAVADIATVRAEVKAARAMLFLVYCDAAQVGAVVLRLDHFATHDEGVIVAAGGNAPGVKLLRALLPALEQKFPSAARVRIHTRRRGMLRELKRAGYSLQEFVLSKAAPFVPIPQQCQQQQGGGGGGSSSSSTTQTANIDKRLVVDAGTGVSADNSTVTVSTLDANAVGKSFDFGNRALDNVVDYGKSAMAQTGAVSKYAIDLSTLTVDRVLDIADTVFGGAFQTIDKNAQLIERTGSFVDKAYADAKGSGAERFYIGAGVVAAVAIVAVYAGRR